MVCGTVSQLKELVSVKQYKDMEQLEKRLTVFTMWLKDHSEPWDERDGAMEQAIKRSKVETMAEIGSMLEEILLMTDEQIKNEL